MEGGGGEGGGTSIQCLKGEVCGRQQRNASHLTWVHIQLVVPPIQPPFPRPAVSPPMLLLFGHMLRFELACMMFLNPVHLSSPPGSLQDSSGGKTGSTKSGGGILDFFGGSSSGNQPTSGLQKPTSLTTGPFVSPFLLALFQRKLPLQSTKLAALRVSHPCGVVREAPNDPSRRTIDSFPGK